MFEDNIDWNLLSSQSLSSHNSNSYGHLKPLDSDEASDSTSAYSVDHTVSQLEGLFYYFGLRGQIKPGPKLIYRTSKDIFKKPYGKSQGFCKKQLMTVHKHAKLSENNLWDTVRDETAGILDRHQINFTSIDLVRFRWAEKTRHGSNKTVTSPATIWIGVLPHSTSGNAAFYCAEDILRLLEGYGIDDIDIAFRESVARPFGSTGPILYSPVGDFHPLKGVIDWVTTALSLPIAGLDSPNTEGTLGFYFKVGEDLYGVTARHVLFPAMEGNIAYTYDTPASNSKRKKKHVTLMGTQAFKNLLESVEEHIKRFTDTVAGSENNIRLRAKWIHSEAAALEEEQKHLDKMKGRIVELQKFLETLKKDWSNIKNRIIGHIVWSPPISGLSPGAPRGFTRDLCVIKLDKKKVLPNLMGNAIDIGTVMDMGSLIKRLYPEPQEVPVDFDYSFYGLYNLKSILPVAEFKEPNIVDTNGHPARFVFRSGGPTPGTTTGLLNGFLSRARRYTLLGNFDSIEAAVLPYDTVRGPFSQGSDSGAAIVGSYHEIVAQLTAGTGSSQFCDIAYATPMDWLWKNVIKPEFPDAILFFDVPAQK